MVYGNYTHCSYSPTLLPWPQYHYHRNRGNNNNQQDRYGDQHYHKQCGCTPCPFINTPSGRVGGCEGDVGRGCGHTLHQLPLTPWTRLVHWGVPLGLKHNVNSNLCVCMYEYGQRSALSRSPNSDATTLFTHSCTHCNCASINGPSFPTTSHSTAAEVIDSCCDSMRPPGGETPTGGWNCWLTNHKSTTSHELLTCGMQLAYWSDTAARVLHFTYHTIGLVSPIKLIIWLV